MCNVDLQCHLLSLRWDEMAEAWFQIYKSMRLQFGIADPLNGQSSAKDSLRGVKSITQPRRHHLPMLDIRQLQALILQTFSSFVGNVLVTEIL